MIGRLLCWLGWHRWRVVRHVARFMEVIKPYMVYLVVEREHEVYVQCCTRCGRTR